MGILLVALVLLAGLCMFCALASSNSHSPGLMMLGLNPCPKKGCGGRSGLMLSNTTARCSKCGKVRPYVSNVRLGVQGAVSITESQGREIIESGYNPEVADRIVQENLLKQKALQTES